jgi:hypothetical protein
MTDKTSTPPSGGRGAGASFAPVLTIRNGVTDIDFLHQGLWRGGKFPSA